jgi:opine dehydrogenase
VSLALRVAVLGGSHGGYAAAADLSLRGHRVRLWRRSATDFEAVLRTRRIRFDGDGIAGEAVLDRATTDLKEALDGAQVVLVPLPATAQEDVATRCAPHLTGEEVVMLTPGSLGTLVFARAVRHAQGKAPLALAETGSLPYLARKMGPAAVSAPVHAANLPTGVFPASRTEPTLDLLARLYPSVRPCADALDAALTNTGPVTHPPLMLLNAGLIDSGRSVLDAGDCTPAVLRVISAVDAERVRIREALGYVAPHYELDTAAEGLYGVGAREKLAQSGLPNEALTLGHRYVTEDVELGLALLVSLAEAVETPTPVCRSILTLFALLLGRDPLAEGRTWERLGLKGLGRDRVRSILRTGGDFL